MKKQGPLLGLFLSVTSLGLCAGIEPIKAQEPTAFLEWSFSDQLFDVNSLPTLADLDSLSEEELKILYERLIKIYEAYEALPEDQKAKYAQFFNRVKELLTWFTSQVMPLEEIQTIFRLYNVWSGEHLFTSNSEEIQTLLKTGWWKLEGSAWSAPSISAWPVYRLMDPLTLEHFYTMNEDEYNSLQAKGFKGEGIGFYSAEFDQKPLYRLLNPNAVFGAHHYTADANERDVLLSKGWKEEGIAWYGLDGSMDFTDASSFQDMIEESASPFS